MKTHPIRKNAKQHRFQDGVEQKHCGKCNCWLELAEFNKDRNRPDGKAPHCRPCINGRARDTYVPSEDYVPGVYEPVSYKRRREKKWRRLGIKNERGDHFTWEDYERLYSGYCDACGVDSPGGAGGWHVDHDHASGRCRGILCARCNLALGYYEKYRELAETYLEKYR